jgi:hypothetical protein
MKRILLTLLALFSVTSLALGQAGVGAGGKPYLDYSNALVDFGTFKVDSGALTGQPGSLVSHVQVSLTAAQIIAMYTTPVLLVAAPASGHELIVTKAVLKITRTSTAFTGGGVGIIQYGSTTHGGGTQACDSTIASTVITGSAGTTHTWRSGLTNLSDNSALDATGLYISNQTAVFADGTGTATVDVWYYVD